MSVRIRITILFASLVFIILAIVCTSIYYFSYTTRLSLIKTRLTNRGITTARLLSQAELFDQGLIERIDSLTTISLLYKSVQAYNVHNVRIYKYSDVPGDSIEVSKAMLDNARAYGSYYFTQGSKDGVVAYYNPGPYGVLVVCTALDIDGKNQLHDLQKILALSFIAGIGIAIVGGYFFSKSLLRPVRKIVGEVNEISAQNLTRRIATTGSRDEWQELTTTLNDLLDRLQSSFELQRRFISNASHELSTPLTSISSQLEIALQRERSGDTYRGILSSVLQDVQHISRLTQTLLEFAIATGDKGGLIISLVRIDEIILELPSTLHRQDPNNQLSLQFGEFPDHEDKLLVLGNAELLFTAIKNIVVNACKYSGDQKAVLSLDMRDDEFVIAVSDNGIGIPEEELTRIFQPFYRVDESRATQGFGLGLSLAYQIIKMHKGNISVTSEPGAGSVFTITLPAAG